MVDRTLTGRGSCSTYLDYVGCGNLCIFNRHLWVLSATVLLQLFPSGKGLPTEATAKTAPGSGGMFGGNMVLQRPLEMEGG